MIPYETFPMHEKVQEERFFLIKKEFSIPYTESRMKLTDFNDDFDCFEFERGYIIEIKPFKYSVDGTLYTYLVNYYIDDEKFQCGYETAMSLDFVLRNKMVFQDVTMVMKRDKKIDDLLS